MTRVALAVIAFDAGTQIRAAIDPSVVAEYAEAMTGGAQFPPIVLFHDGSQHYLADGFHRFLAAQRNTFTDIDADVRPGTKEDALWFALGANQIHGVRMTYADKRHAVALAFQTWPDRSATQIAEQLGVSQSFVSRQKEQVMPSLPERVMGKDGKRYPATRRQASPETSAPPFRSRAAVQARRAQMREMAEAGHSSRQIAAALNLSEEGCRARLRKEDIDVPADRALGKAKHHDSRRIVAQMVMDAENLTADVNLIDFRDLARPDLAGWIGSLTAARDQLGAFIRRLMKEQQKHEAA